ncbi:DUF2309 domain-containing protein [Pedobacter glucosidilyticus]|uniref:DUF2309 domain-containing protein n=1 Tax=Pedobacter glucosidilyticus TaxID=1122941 RepID=UPI0026EE7B48|nr:DUF2309 domain-containing protein [Pedobacter glucosidilyticus]
MNPQLQSNINKASEVIGKTWPLYSFVTSNPLSGFEKSNFLSAIQQATKYWGGYALPEASVFEDAWKNGEINQTILTALLVEKDFNKQPEFYLQQMAEQSHEKGKNANHDVDSMMCKWLAAFLDEGFAEWEMPYKSDGFFTAWRKLAKYDKELNHTRKDIPKDATSTLELILKDYDEKDQLEIFKYHIAALPGWTGFIKHRVQGNTAWQQKYPISLADYLAVRLWITKSKDSELLPLASTKQQQNTDLELKYIWLKAWEQSWQQQLSKTLKPSLTLGSIATKKLSDAQFVFCIDTRSELMRRHLEAKGNYETFGYAGFFGIAMDYKNPENGLVRKSCPPIVNSAYQVTEIAQKGKELKLSTYLKQAEETKFSNYFLKRLKNMLPSAFGFVEISGLLYGVSLTARTIFPAYLNRIKKQHKPNHEHICETSIHAYADEHTELGIPISEKAAIVKSAFDLLGWKEFAPLVIFTGHGSQSANNPFASSLDCGACAASPGRHNARMLAKIANQNAVRIYLKEVYEIEIPDDTFFMGAEHNTATDEITLFDSQAPESHQQLIQKLKSDLKQVQLSAAKERLGTDKDAVKLALKKSNNWAETRPEWGLARNAAFIVGPRNLTKNLHLGGRCFLHSYDWETDSEGKALESIMQGPMVVGQWINNHYYFSTVNNDQFGGGSKITQNVIGKFGVVQGNGGDLKIGIPLQSVKASDQKNYHQPLRLSVVIQAPTAWIVDIIERNEHIKTLLHHEWIYLMVMDPLKDNDIKLYNKNWISEKNRVAEFID